MANNTGYKASGNSNNAVSTLSTDNWHMLFINNGQEGGIPEDKDTCKGFTSAPAGVTGE